MLYITSLVLIYRTTGVCTSQPPLPIPPPLPLPLVTTKLISFSMIFFFLSIWKWSVKMLSHVWLFAAPWSVTLQASLSMRFSRQENWSELPFPSLRDLPGPGIEPGCSALQADCLPSERDHTVFIYIFLSDFTWHNAFKVHSCHLKGWLLLRKF